nr:skin secretory protein xP2-like [Aegilops tauschii subsp. strangulata]
MGPEGPTSVPGGRCQSTPPRSPAANDAAAAQSPPPPASGTPAAAQDRRRLKAPPGASPSRAGGTPEGEGPGAVAASVAQARPAEGAIDGGGEVVERWGALTGKGGGGHGRSPAGATRSRFGERACARAFLAMEDVNTQNSGSGTAQSFFCTRLRRPEVASCRPDDADDIDAVRLPPPSAVYVVAVALPRPRRTLPRPLDAPCPDLAVAHAERPAPTSASLACSVSPRRSPSSPLPPTSQRRRAPAPMPPPAPTLPPAPAPTTKQAPCSYAKNFYS